MKEMLKNLNTKMAEKHLIEGGERVTYEEAKNAITNPENFAKRIQEKKEEIEDGISLTSKTIELGDGYFTNMYDISFNNQNTKLTTKILTREKPIYPHRIFVNEKNKEEKPLVCINGAFFFLQDEQLEKTPKDVMYNLNIKNGQILGLPAVTREAIYTNKDGKIQAQEIKAKGKIKVGDTEINWIGGEPIAHKGNIDEVKENEAVLFNSACCTIQYEKPEDKTSLRKLRKDLNKTPENANKTDLIVSENEQGKLIVKKINMGGGTDFFDGNFILQIENSLALSIKEGDEVKPETLDNLNLSKVQSAMTSGPFVSHFLKNNDHPINHDPSLGTFPPFDPNARYARSIMYEDSKGETHLVVFDAVPRSQFMKGVTPKEASEQIPEDANWAVFLDGGQSSRLTFVNKNNKSEIEARGNMQYVRLHERYKTGQGSVKEDQFLWSKKGRPLTSMIVVYTKPN